MDGEMIRIDGSVGEGGGQMLRTSLTMSAVTGRAFEMVNIRAKRKVPGLKRQHLTCVRAVAEICGAQVTGDDVQSQVITFQPGPIQGGDCRFEIGTAGSVTLVAQTVVPVLLCADAPSKVVITGGTHVPMSPSWDFFVQTYLPQLRAMGAEVTAKLRQYGLYPAGGGEVVIEVHPWKAVRPLRLLERGAEDTLFVIAKVAHLSRSIAADETLHIARQLSSPALLHVESIESQGPGNYAILSCPFENVTMIFSEIGTYNKSRKAVANSVAHQAQKYLRAAHVADEYLSDQLLLPILLAGRSLDATESLWGVFSMPIRHSCHFETNWAILQHFCTDCEMVKKGHPLCKYSSIVYIGKKGIIQNEVAEV